MDKDPWDKDPERKAPWESETRINNLWGKDPQEPEKALPPPEPIDPKVYRLVTPHGREFWLGFLYLFLHLFFLGDIIYLVLWDLGLEFSLVQVNLIFMALGTVFLLLTMRRFLQESFVRFLHFGLSNLWVLPLGYAIRFALSIPVTLIFVDFASTLETTVGPNEELVRDFLYQNPLPSIFMVVILAPILEEILFRGVIFGPLRKKSRFLAYFVSTALFAFLHIVAFLLLTFDPSLFFIMLFYVPAGIAFCWAYEKSGSIWTAILLHAVMNLVAVLLGPVLL